LGYIGSVTTLKKDPSAREAAQALHAVAIFKNKKYKDISNQTGIPVERVARVLRGERVPRTGEVLGIARALGLDGEEK